MSELVVVSLEAWDEVWRRNQHLVSGLVDADPDLRVLFVEPAAYPVGDLRRRRVPRRGKGLREGSLPGARGRGRLWLFQPTKRLPRRLDAATDSRWARDVVGAATRLGFRAPVLWVNDPSGAHVLADTRWPALYDITDDWLEAERAPAERQRLMRNEAYLMEHCNEVVVCSPRLYDTKGRTRPVSLVRNAVDAAAYSVVAPRPAGLPPGPTAVYAGTVHTDRVDIGLCESVARALGPTGHLVLVGPALLSGPHRARLLAAGVVLTGAVPRAEVPGYLQHADVLVVPHVVDAFTDTLDPIKLYEYRAAGRPVVSTPVAGFRETSDARTTLATGEAFVDAVGRAVPATDPFPCAGGEGMATWADRVSQMRAVLDRVSPRAR